MYIGGKNKLIISTNHSICPCAHRSYGTSIAMPIKNLVITKKTTLRIIARLIRAIMLEYSRFTCRSNSSRNASRFCNNAGKSSCVSIIWRITRSGAPCRSTTRRNSSTDALRSILSILRLNSTKASSDSTLVL